MDRYNKMMTSLSGWGRLPVLTILLLAGSLGGCSGLFDVENPNQVLRDDLENPAAASAVANGALSTVARGVASAVLPISVVGDELRWVGSYDTGKELEQGILWHAQNNYTTSAYSGLAVGRWMADEAIEILSGLEEEGLLPDLNDLARSYLYAAIAYTMAADIFEDFTLSDGREPGPPIGKERMYTLYEKAIEYLTEGMAIADATGESELYATLLAVRARAHHAYGVWKKVHQGTPGGDPLVSEPGAVQDAEEFLSRSLADDWAFRFTYSVNTISNSMSGETNERQEFRIGDRYIEPDASGKRVGAVIMEDPIDGLVDPVLSRAVNEFSGARRYAPLTVTSSREMRLILAEAALADGDPVKAAEHLNAIRALDGLSPYEDQIELVELLRHMRIVNLFLQGRRLSDMYRFGEVSEHWLEDSQAALQPGAKLPISELEQNANCHIVGIC